MLAERAKRVSPHFTWWELLATSHRGVANVPTELQARNLVRLAHTILEPIRREFGVYIITSGFRSDALNRIVGGSKTSAHRDGRAADGAPANAGVSWTDVISYALLYLPVDQVIYEHPPGTYGWLHLGIAREDEEPRKQALMYFGGGIYSPWDPTDPRVTR